MIPSNCQTTVKTCTLLLVLSVVVGSQLIPDQFVEALAKQLPNMNSFFNPVPVLPAVSRAYREVKVIISNGEVAGCFCKVLWCSVKRVISKLDILNAFNSYISFFLP